MDMMTEVFNVGDKVECVRDSPDNNDSIAIGVQGVICVIVDSSPHIGVRWNEKADTTEFDKLFESFSREAIS